jgi:hypothetical protein
MISWLSQQEKIASFEVYLSAMAKSTEGQETAMPNNNIKGGISLTKHPNHPNCPIDHLQKYGAVNFNHCLKLYFPDLTQVLYPLVNFSYTPCPSPKSMFITCLDFILISFKTPRKKKI